MPVPTSIHPSYLTWLGLSHESTYGTPQLTATLGPVNVLPLDASTFQPEDKPVWLKDMAIRGSMADVYAIIQGVEDSAWSLGGPAYPGLTPILLDNMFGDITTVATGSSATGSDTTTGYTRGVTGLNIPMSAGADFTTAGQVGVITSTGVPAYYEYFVTTGAFAAGNLPIKNPLHFTYPSTSTVKVVTGTTSFSHKFAALNAYDGQPPTYTLLDATAVTDTLNGTLSTDADPYGQRYYTSVCMAQLDFTISSEALFTQKASGTGFRSHPTSALSSPPTAPYAVPSIATGTIPIPSWSSNVSLALPDVAFGAVNYVGEVTFSLKRKIQVYWTDDGSQDPYIIARGPLGVTGTVKGVVAQDEQILQSMLQNFQGRLQAQVVFPTGVHNAAFPPSALQGLIAFQFDINQAAFTAAKPTRSAVLVGYDSTFEGVANATNVGQSGGLGPITVTCVDLNPGY